MREQINHWWEGQARGNIECHNLDHTAPSFRANARLKLCYLLLYIYIGRPFLFLDDSHQQTTTIDGNPAPQQHSASVTGIPTLADGCVQAATQIIDLLQYLSDSVGLSRASYTEFSSCRASLLVLLTEWLRSGQRKKVAFALDRGMHLIQQMTGGNSNKSEVSLIEYLERAIQYISASFPQVDRFGNRPPASEEPEKAYSSFKAWAQMKRAESAPANNPHTSTLGPRPISPSNPQDDLIDAAELFNTAWSFSDDDSSLDPFLFPLVPGQN